MVRPEDVQVDVNGAAPGSAAGGRGRPGGRRERGAGGAALGGAGEPGQLGVIEDVEDESADVAGSIRRDKELPAAEA